MKDDQKILVVACAFAVFLVGQKKGWFKAAPVLGPSFQFPGADLGYRPNEPGAYVSTDDIIRGATDNDWQNVPETVFDQNIDDLLSPDPMAGFWRPDYYRAIR